VGDGFVDFALLPRSVAATIDAAHGRGLRYEGSVDGGRVRPNGARLEWQLGKPATPDLPFLCGDITPRELRVAQGDVRQHRNGVLGVASVNIAVRDLDASVTRYRALLGEPLSVHRASLAGYGMAFASFPLGTTTTTLITPTHNAAASDTEEPAADLAHKLRTQLAKRGEGLFGVTLHTNNVEFARTLPLALTHDALIDIVETR
jgi:catechol 2,3-dioxygenase-like lactoylglutathione lyase family enzyme